MITGLIALALLGVPEQKMTYRQYAVPHVTTILDQIDLDNGLLTNWAGVDFAVLTQDITVPDAGAENYTTNTNIQVARAQALGFKAYPGMRLYPANTALALTEAHWDGTADTMELLLQSATEGRVQVDVEDYGSSILLDDATLTSNGMTVNDLKRVMSALLVALNGYHCDLYPFNPDDNAHLLIMEACASSAVFSERSFTLVETKRTNGVAYKGTFETLFKEQLDISAAIPGTPMVLGIYDDYLKPWGKPLRDAVAAGELGEGVDLWFFDFYRGNRTYAADWFSGLNFDTRNDLRHGWTGEGSIGPEHFFANFWCADVVNTGANSHGTIWGTCAAGGHTTEVGPYGGVIVDDGEYLWPNANGDDDLWLDGTEHSVQIQLVIPSTTTGQIGVLGHFWMWGLYVEGNDLYVRYVDGAGGHVDLTASAIPRDEPVLYTFAFDNTAEVARVGVAHSQAPSSYYEMPTSGPLGMSNETHIYAGRSYVNAAGAKWIYCEDCEIIEDFKIWDRDLTPAELAAMDIDLTYPYGRF